MRNIFKGKSTCPPFLVPVSPRLFLFFFLFVFMFSVVLLACGAMKNNTSPSLMLPWGFLETEVPIMEPGGRNEVWYRAWEIPELGAESPILHYSLIKHKHRWGFSTPSWNHQLNILKGPPSSPAPLPAGRTWRLFHPWMHLLKKVHISINIALLLPTANVAMQLTRVTLTHMHL